MRKIIVFFLIIITILGINNIVKADEIGISQIHIHGEVPESFERDINILLEYEDGNTGLFTLKLNNGYDLNSIIRTGKAKVKQIDIIGNIGQYNVKAQDSIVIEKENISELNIVVEEVELKNIGDKIDEENNFIINEKMKANEGSIKEDEESLEKKEENKSIKKNETLNGLIKKVITTAVILIVILGIYLFIKYKKEC